MSKKVKYSESDLAALITQVEDEFSQHLAKAEEESVKVVETTEEATSEAKVEETVSVAKTESEPSIEEELDYNEEDYVEMDKLYSSMAKSEAEVHLKSLQKALSEENVTKVEVVEETSEKEETIAKSEEKSKESTSLQKSELVQTKNKEIEELKEENQKLEKSFKDLTSAITKYVNRGSAPKQKAVTQIQYVAKSEEEVSKTETKEEDVSKLDVSEISKRLTAKIRGGLEKSERDKIDAYYEDSKRDVSSIQHLL